MRIKYTIDGVDFATKDIFVKESKGVVDLPKLKTPTSHSWNEYHGEIVDLSTIRVQPREITLSCVMTASNEFDFIQKIDTFLKSLMSTKLLCLRIDITGATVPLIYYVYVKDGVSVTKKWRSSNMYGEFSIKFIEPEPIKKIVKVTSENVTLTCSSTTAINIYWGDGDVDTDLYGSISRTHTFDPDLTDVYAVITGVLENISNLSISGGQIVW